MDHRSEIRPASSVPSCENNWGRSPPHTGRSDFGGRRQAALSHLTLQTYDLTLMDASARGQHTQEPGVWRHTPSADHYITLYFIRANTLGYFPKPAHPFSNPLAQSRAHCSSVLGPVLYVLCLFIFISFDCQWSEDKIFHFCTMFPKCPVLFDADYRHSNRVLICWCHGSRRRTTFA